jgi:chemotaxis receptor (MCP) glutamine deamidase CheD
MESGTTPSSATSQPRESTPPSTPSIPFSKQLWQNQSIHYLMPGELWIGPPPEQSLSTLLNSGIAMVFYHQQPDFIGFCHFLTVSHSADCVRRGDAHYGEKATARILRAFSNEGYAPQDIQVKIFGASHMHSDTVASAQHNTTFAFGFVRRNNLRLTSSDTGGNYGRQIYLNPTNFDVKVRKILP